MVSTRGILIWTSVAIATLVPIVGAVSSPLLAWREPIYIASGFAGVIAMVFLLFQPLLVGGYLPGLAMCQSRRAHRGVGSLLVAAIIVHVVGLWMTSPPDVIDALLFRSPTPFSAWGVVAMLAAFAAAVLAAIRRRLRLRPMTWRAAHSALAIVTVLGSVVHAALIEGTMETLSKYALCLLVLGVTVKAMSDLRVWNVRGHKGE